MQGPAIQLQKSCSRMTKPKKFRLLCVKIRIPCFSRWTAWFAWCSFKARESILVRFPSVQSAKFCNENSKCITCPRTQQTTRRHVMYVEVYCTTIRKTFPLPCHTQLTNQISGHQRYIIYHLNKGVVSVETVVLRRWECISR